MCHMGPPVKMAPASHSSIRTGLRGRAIARALRCRGPQWWHLFDINEIFVWTTVMNQKRYRKQLYIPLLRWVSLMISLQAWLSASFSNHYWIQIVSVLFNANIFEFCMWLFLIIVLLAWVYLLVNHAHHTNVAKTILFACLRSKASFAVVVAFSINDSVTSCAVWR